MDLVETMGQRAIWSQQMLRIPPLTKKVFCEAPCQCHDSSLSRGKWRQSTVFFFLIAVSPVQFFKSRSLPTRARYISRITAEPVRQFITSGSAGEEVPANSVFTPAFVDAIEHGLADLNQDGYITGTELGLFLKKR